MAKREDQWLVDAVVLDYGHIQEGQRPVKDVCPKCKGGQSGERSFAVGREGPFLWWMCHRASCGWKSRERLAGNSLHGDEPETTDQRRNGVDREFQRWTIPHQLRDELCAMYHIKPETIQRAKWSYTPDYGGGLGRRVIFPIFDPNGRVRGEQFRSYDGHVLKAKTNMQLAEQAISWYRFRKYSRVLCIVEDIPSALRIAETEQLDAVALLGTTINLDRILEIRDEPYARVWLALDGDALTTAVKSKKDFDPYLPTLRIKQLGDDDVKDMSPEQFDLFIQECIQ